MKKIILHIGSGKTGSSSIQKALEKNQESNASLFTYPKLINMSGNQVFRFGFCSYESTTSNVRKKYVNDADGFADYQKNIKKSFQEETKNADVVVISCEFLFSSPKEEVNRIDEFLQELGFSEIHVVMYLRDPAKYYLSLAQQSLKNQATIPKPHNFKYDLIGAIHNWSSINPASLTVKEFNRDTLEGNDVVKDIRCYLTEIVEGEVKLSLARQQNETMSVEGAIILQEYQTLLSKSQLSFDNDRLHMRRARKFSRIASEGTKPKLKKNLAQFIYHRYHNELYKLNEEYGIFSDILNMTHENIDINMEITEFTDIVERFDINSYLLLKNKL